MSLDYLLNKLANVGRFIDENRQNGNGFELGNHQLMPVFDAVENGLRRFVLAYGTGAGKTVIPIEILKHLKKKGERVRTLVIAPKQTLLDNWNRETLESHSCPAHIHQVRSKQDTHIPHDADFVAINYDKLDPRMGYVDEVVRFASTADLVIVDEFHNVKNRSIKTAEGYRRIIDSSADARLIMLSATPCYDCIRDVGMMLYALKVLETELEEGKSRFRYEHYRELAFDAKKDPEALWELREQGMIRFFDLLDAARFHKLPAFTEEMRRVRMRSEDEDRYFKAFESTFNLGKLHNLERIAIESMINSEDTRRFIGELLRQGYALNFFSHLVNPPKEGSPDEAIFRQLEKMLREVGARNILSISGKTDDSARKRAQAAMASGNLDALINQWDCTSEGFSEVAGSRPVCIIPLRSPYSPGRYIQIIGRSYRPGQDAPVMYMELLAHSDRLMEMIDSYVRDYADQKGIRVKTSWSAMLFHECARNIRRSKQNEITLYLNQRYYGLLGRKDTEISTAREYMHALSKDRILDLSERPDVDFGSGIKRVKKFVGTSYDDGLKGNSEHLGNDFDRPDILLEKPGKVNRFLAERLAMIKEQEGARQSQWSIADLGCCTSAVFSQASILYHSMQGVKGAELGIDRITSVDGEPGFVARAKDYLNRKKWTACITDIGEDGFSTEELEEAKRRVESSPAMDCLDFKVANFATEEFGKGYDAVVTSQCLHYNDQNDKRDIEQIVRNVNRSLRMGGHYLAVLVGGASKNSFTRPQDIEGFKTILSAYGFSIAEQSDQAVQNRGKISKYFFHYFHAVKTAEAGDSLVEFEVVPQVYAKMREKLTGGYKLENLVKEIRREDEEETYGS